MIFINFYLILNLTSYFYFSVLTQNNDYFCLRDFFSHCDGIFLNYNWTESRLSKSRIFAKELGRDIKDIYVGLDVWGRGCPGGGGFNSAYVITIILLLLLYHCYLLLLYCLIISRKIKLR